VFDVGGGDNHPNFPFSVKIPTLGDALKVKQKVDFKFVDKMRKCPPHFQKFHCFWQILSTFQQSIDKHK